MNLADSLSEAVQWHRQGRLQEACAVYAQVLRKDPHNPAALQWLATAHAQRGDFVKAMELYDQALKQAPDYTEAHANRGNVLRYLARFAEALESYDRALVLKPDFAKAHHHQGITLRDMQRFDEALASHDRATELDPGDAQAWNWRGNMLQRLRRHEEAVQAYDQAIKLKPSYAEAHYNRSLPLRDMLRLKEAIQSCERAIGIRSHYAEAWWNQAEMRILSGDYERGWPMFAWRWRSMEYGKVLRTFDAPLWLGTEPLRGKTLLVTLDGGFGDTLHFCRYAPLLSARGAEVILEVQPGLVGLLQHSFENVRVIPNGQALPPFDCHCPMMNLPGAFAQPLTEIPAALPYLQMPPSVTAKWAARLGPKTRPRIGLVWSGSMDHSNDARRSLPAALMALLTRQDAEFHCLQKHIRDSDRPALETLPIRTWENELTDFTETAELVMNMDLVISADTSVAHLAGALGRSVWVLLPYVPDMRWLLGREDSPWYPEVMRLFRQTPSQHWPDVLLLVQLELEKLVGCIPPPHSFPSPDQGSLCPDLAA